MKRITGILAVLLLATACGEELMTYNLATGMPVVESYLQEGTNTLTVRLYTMEVYLKDGYEFSSPISGLQLNINGKTLTETGKGTYFLNLGNDTVRGLQNYNLSFEYLGKTVSASTSVPKSVTNLNIEPASVTRTSSAYFWDTADTTGIRLTWDDPDRSYYQIYIESPASSDMPSPDGGITFRRRMMQPFQGCSYTTSSREFRTAGNYSIYIYRVNKEYADLYERTGATDSANPHSAIENAFGIFTAMSVAKIGFQVIEAEE
jgi:hypothetical protein